MDAVETVETEVRELIRRTGLDPVRETAEIADLVRSAVTDYDERSTHGGLPMIGNLESAVKAVLDTVAGFGPLQRYFDDPLVEEIWINSPSQVFVARNGVAELTTTVLTGDEVRDLVEKMLKSSGRRIDLSSPFVDATLPDLSVIKLRWGCSDRCRAQAVLSDVGGSLICKKGMTCTPGQYARAARMAGLGCATNRPGSPYAR